MTITLLMKDSIILMSMIPMKDNSFRFLLVADHSLDSVQAGNLVFPAPVRSLAVDPEPVAAKALHLQAHHHPLHHNNNNFKHLQLIQAQSPDASFDLRMFG